MDEETVMDPKTPIITSKTEITEDGEVLLDHNEVSEDESDV